LLSDQDNRLSAALRLPAFRASGQLRLKRLTLLVDHERRIRAVQFPILDPAASVDEALDLLADLAAAASQNGAADRLT
jgi:peroxiredoxin